jgi:hypothetical protein
MRDQNTTRSSQGRAAAQDPLVSVVQGLLSSGTAKFSPESGRLVSATTGLPIDLKTLPYQPNGSAMAKNKSKPAKDIVPEEYTQAFLDFINENPTIFHAVEYFCSRLESEGFTRLSEKDIWFNLDIGGKYFVTRNDSSLVAFSIPMEYELGNGVGERYMPYLAR